MRKFLASTVVIFSLFGTAQAQDMKPLAEVAVNAAAPYAPARCAGLYQAMMEWIGIEKICLATFCCALPNESAKAAHKSRHSCVASSSRERKVKYISSRRHSGSLSLCYIHFCQHSCQAFYTHH